MDHWTKMSGRLTLIVGVHGAGLSNALFTAAAFAAAPPAPAPAPPPAPPPPPPHRHCRPKMIEIVPGASSFHSEYVLLAGALGLDHHAYVVGGGRQV